MNPSIKKLAGLAKKESRKIIGLMSGTSLDGLDIALCTISGTGADTKVTLNRFTTKSYDESIKKRLRKISSVELAELREICYQHTSLAILHAEMILDALNEWIVEPGDVDCIASHGQTIYHLPARDQVEEKYPINTTLQIGDGDHIAAKTGILTVSDFRQKHIAHGGEGAPMAALADRLLFGHKTESRILLNIGGIGNFTTLPALNQPHQPSFTTDTGPGNTLIDKLVQTWFNLPFDNNAMIAKSGTIIQKLLDELLSDEWFSGQGSKSTGPEYFSMAWLKKKAENAGLNIEKSERSDVIATVTELSAITISNSISAQIEPGGNPVIYVSGGGAHNPLLMRRINELLDGLEVKNISELGIDPDAKEAVIFAVLANEMLAGVGFDFEEGTGAHRKVNFGKISFPD